MNHTVWSITEEEEIFDPVLSVNQGGERGKFMLIEHIEDEYDGIFPRISDYTRMANRIERDGISEFITWLSKRSNKLKADTGYCKIEREAKYKSEATLFFNKPITVCLGEINGKPITALVNKIKGEFTWEWFWFKNGRQNKIANGFDVWFDCQEYFLIT